MEARASLTVYSCPIPGNYSTPNTDFSVSEFALPLGQYVITFAIGLFSLLVPVSILYLATYALVVGNKKTFKFLIACSLAIFLGQPIINPIQCKPIQSLQLVAVAIGTMRALDIFARHPNLPTYAHSPKPPPAIFTLILLTELRYESFTPNPIRTSLGTSKFSEHTQLALHMAAFAGLQSLPQTHPTILALEVLLSIYVILESMQLAVRYKSSPALFGPIYKADSLSGFWSETWHNVFAAPCQSLAYEPIRHTLLAYGVPAPVARSLGVVGAFGLMAVFHVAVLAPLLPLEGLVRIGLFFLLNGVGTVVEAMIWGRRKHWAKIALAWGFELLLATWTAQAAHIPNGFSQLPWRNICGVQ